MKLKIDFDIPESEHKISYSSKSIFIGSCFSDEISSKFVESGLDVLTNPFGTLFHPLAIAHVFTDFDVEATCFQRGDLWFSWCCSGVIYDTSKESLVSKIRLIKNQFNAYLQEADFLFVTFGTSFGYRLKEGDSIVANCHKMPSVLFDKELSSLVEMTSEWCLILNRLNKINPNLKVVFTVSPVRHIKDGVSENNVSKSFLFALINDLEALYFPSFEIINDELRDYRFFKEDLVHPNEQAIQYIWQKFLSTYMDRETANIIDEVVSVRRMEQHKSLYPESIEYQKFLTSIIRKKDELSLKVPNIKW